MRSLFDRDRPGPRGRSIEVPGLLPGWLQLALFGVATLVTLVIAGAALYWLVQAALFLIQ